jgi:AcrR family transcriptional regulator
MQDVLLRRTPQQTRSQQRVDLILDVAADLFAREGYDPVTTNAIAAQAGISIGSLYRYFPDKDTILRALVHRYNEQLRALYDEVFTKDAVYLPLSVLLDRLIDPMVAFHIDCPAFKQILLGSDVSSDIAEASTKLEEETTERIKGFLQLGVPDLDEEQALLIATVCKATVKSLFAMITPDSDEEFRGRATAEVKRMLLAYLEPLLGGEAG